MESNKYQQKPKISMGRPNANFFMVIALFIVIIAVAFGYIANLFSEVENRFRIVFLGLETNLENMDKVLINGKIGTIHEIKSVVNKPECLITIISVLPGIQFETNTIATFEQSPITGVAQIKFNGSNEYGSDEMAIECFNLTDENNSIPTIFAKKSSTEIEPPSSLIVQIPALDKILDNKSTQIDTIFTNIVTITTNLATETEELGLITDNVKNATTNVLNLTDAVKPNKIKQFVNNLNSTIIQVQKLIQAVDSKKIENIIDEIKMTTENVKVFSQGLANKSVEIESIIFDIKLITENVKVFSQGLANTPEEIESIIDDIKLTTGNVKVFSQGLANKSEEIKNIIGDIKSTAGNVKNFSQGLMDKLEEIENIIDYIKSTTENVKDFSQGFANKSKEIENIIADIKSTTKNVKEFSSALNLKSKNIQETIIKVEHIVLKIDNILQNFTENPGDLPPLLDQISSLMNELKMATSQVRIAAGKIGDKVNELNVNEINNLLINYKNLIANVKEKLDAIEKLFNNGEGKLFTNFSNMMNKLDEFSGIGLDSLLQLIEEAKATLRRLNYAENYFEPDSAKVNSGRSNLPKFSEEEN